MLTVIGCGNPNRSDDGVGVLLAQRLQARFAKHPVPGVQIFDCGTAGVDVMFRARGSSALLVVDAARTGAEPGTIYDVPGETLASVHEPTYSLHDFRWDHALAAGRRIFKDDFPTDVRVWLVEAESLELGLELTPRVADALEEVHRRALAWIADRVAERHRDADVQVELHQGSVRLTRQVYERFFEGRPGALLMVRDERLCIVPVDELAGGLLVKQRNAQGDRVIPGAELLRAHAADTFEGDVPVTWDAELGALCIDLKEVRS